MSGESAGGPSAGRTSSEFDWRKWGAILSVLVAITVLVKWVSGVSSWQDACTRWLWCSGPLPSSTTIFPTSFSVGNGVGSSIEYTAVVRSASWRTSGANICIHVSCSASVIATYQNFAGTTGDVSAEVVRYKDAATASSADGWLSSVVPPASSPTFATKGSYLVEVRACCWQPDWSKGVVTDEWLVSLELTNLIVAGLPSS